MKIKLSAVYCFYLKALLSLLDSSAFFYVHNLQNKALIFGLHRSFKYGKIYVRHKLNSFSLQGRIFTSVKMHALISILVRMFSLCRNKSSRAFFCVARLGHAFFV